MSRYDHEGENQPESFAQAFASIEPKQAAARLAYNLGRTLDLRAQKHAAADVDSVNALIAALPGKAYLEAMREAFNAADFFTRATLPVIRAAMEEMGSEGADPKAKKAALAAIAATDAKATGWLPSELRHPDYSLTTGKRRKAA